LPTLSDFKMEETEVKDEVVEDEFPYHDADGPSCDQAPARRRLIKCSRCEFWREEGAQMARHLLSMHSHERTNIENYALCRYDVCDYRANDMRALAQHEELPHGVSQANFCLAPFTRCPYCNTRLVALGHYKEHMLTQHHDLMFSPGKRRVICVACSFKSATVFEMIWHWQQQDGRCELGMKFSDYAATQMRKHPQPTQFRLGGASAARDGRTTDRLFLAHQTRKVRKCPKCDFKTILPLAMKNHLKFTDCKPSFSLIDRNNDSIPLLPSP
ncbi:hypothetical protein PFISCL1PPCAC_4443, partial [Pristionchus fissidentatus]